MVVLKKDKKKEENNNGELVPKLLGCGSYTVFGEVSLSSHQEAITTTTKCCLGL